MSTNNEKIKVTTIKGGKRVKYKSPFKIDKEMANLNQYELNNTDQDVNIIDNSSNNYIHDITEEKEKKLPFSSKRAYLSKMNNSLNNFSFKDNTFSFPMSNRDISVLTDSTLLENNANNSKIISNKNNKNILINPNLNSNILDKKFGLNKINASINSSGIINENSSNQIDPYDSKYSIKINKIKDDYIDFLQKEFEDNTLKSVKLDTNNKELLKKCDDLMNDNRILTNTLNERTSKLNQIIQENLMVKSRLDKSVLNNQKNEQKLEYYEEQFNLFKTSNDNYQKIISELREQNNQLNSNLVEMEKANEENLKNAEENFKIHLQEEIESTKKEMEELYNFKNMEINEKNEKKEQVYIDKIKELEEKNEKLTSDLTNKNNMFEMICKENEKLTSEISLFRSQVEQYSHQINELNTIIKHKDNIINNLKTEFLNNEKLLNKSISTSMMKLDGSEFLNENISKLITDNEENKMKIELLNDKIKSIDEMEKKYNEIMNGPRTLSLSEKLAYQINTNSPKNISTHFNYSNINDIKNSNLKNSANKYTNNNYKSFISPKKLHLEEDYNDAFNSSEIIKNKYEKTDFTIPVKDMNQKTRNSGNNYIIYSSNITKDNKRKKIKDNTINENRPRNRINIDREIKVTKKGNKPTEIKDYKNSNKTKIIEIKTTPIKGRYYQKLEENRIKGFEENENELLASHGKELEIEKDEVKESIREMNRKKNYTYKPKMINHSLENMKYEKGNFDQLITIGHNYIDKIIEEGNVEQNTFYLYGIDRSDMLHTFNVNEKKWCDIRKITDIDDKSDTFKKDYQYEGTLLYNTLNGVYILTGEKTDTLYYLNSQTNSIIKVCKFNNCHDNGSIMFDTNNNCLFVFGGKKINACEYYSFSDKKVYKLPDLITDRANASFIISNNKIFGFFGFSYSKNNYAKNIEYIDFTKKDKWFELKNIQFLKQDITFDTESVATMYYKQNPNQILIYCGIQGDEEDFVTEYYLLYDARNNSIDKINKWNMQQYKSSGKRWKNYNFKVNDPKGFHFAKNTRFILLPKDNNYEGYNERDSIDIMIDYKNNIHYIIQEKQKIDIYRSDM